MERVPLVTVAEGLVRMVAVQHCADARSRALHLTIVVVAVVIAARKGIVSI